MHPVQGSAQKGIPRRWGFLVPSNLSYVFSQHLDRPPITDWEKQPLVQSAKTKAFSQGGGGGGGRGESAKFWDKLLGVGSHQLWVIGSLFLPDLDTTLT